MPYRHELMGALKTLEKTLVDMRDVNFEKSVQGLVDEWATMKVKRAGKRAKVSLA